MKVTLKGIKKEHLNFSPERFIDCLKQVPYPVVVETDPNDETIVCLKQYIVDPLSPDSYEEWGLLWFDYEKVQE